jgi:hypothetical protein
MRSSVYDRTLNAGFLKSGDNLAKRLWVHSHSAGLRIDPVQMRLIENMPVAALFPKNKSSRVVGSNARHCSRRFVAGHDLKDWVSSAESNRFIIREKPQSPCLHVDYAHPYVGWLFRDLGFNMSKLCGIARRGHGASFVN